MNAAFDGADSTPAKTPGVVRPGPIIVARHGKPALNRELGPRLDWRDYEKWWSQYEAGSLEGGQTCPPRLIEAARGDAVFFSSVRPRAIETAMQISQGQDITRLPVFNEAPLPPPRLSDRHMYLPKTWNVISRVSWLLGNANGQESAPETRHRAGEAADVLIRAAEQNGKVVLAAHGWFNRMLTRPMRQRGWKCVRNGGDSYWSYRVYEPR